jgi:hypothetical protein
MAFHTRPASSQSQESDQPLTEHHFFLGQTAYWLAAQISRFSNSIEDVMSVEAEAVRNELAALAAAVDTTIANLAASKAAVDQADADAAADKQALIDAKVQIAALTSKLTG